MRKNWEVKEKKKRIERNGGIEMVKDLVEKLIERMKLKKKERLRKGGCEIDKGEELWRRKIEKWKDGWREECRSLRVIERRGIKRNIERGEIGWKRGEGVSLGRKRRGEDENGKKYRRGIIYLWGE